MRYSMLVYITNMSKTLLDAAQYLSTTPDGAAKAEILDSGKTMLTQIREVLEAHKSDLHSQKPLELLTEAASAWGTSQAEGYLTQLIQCLPREISYQVRAVFFAELGEKWDAMDSVYQFMRDDPRFDPVVVRTPIGRVVTQNGERRQETIYKDFLTPMGIPSLDFNRYSLEQDCPELAFTSQPYESCTIRKFWPETIAKYTRLVYLPYFLPSIVLKDYPQTLCQMPIYDKAWKVVGANQKHFEYYKKYSHHGGSNMIVTGVPKTDPIIKLKEHGVPLPSGWECVQGKITFLWNTWFSIEASSFHFFEDVFAWFQEHKECALIWRPHPMTDTVVKLYTPDRYSYFQQCLERVRKAENMVLDEETSFEPSFYYSNAQISDHSSLMHQYLLMDKPLLWFQNLAESMTGEELVGCQWMEQTKNWSGILAFLEQIKQGKDLHTALRQEICRCDLPLADGKSGERVCQTLWEELHIEDGIEMTEGRY